jgi:hypothetical protein
MWNACAKRDCENLEGWQHAHNQPITLISDKIIFYSQYAQKSGIDNELLTI